MYMHEVFAHFLFIIIEIYFNVCVATAASRHNETEAESQARHARNSQGLYMLDVFAHVFNYYLNIFVIID